MHMAYDFNKMCEFQNLNKFVMPTNKVTSFV